MNLPKFFNPANAGKFDYIPNIEAISKEAEQHSIPLPTENVQLVIVDYQKDFCSPNGSLFVGGRSGDGAVQDSIRLSKFIYNNLEYISGITTTMDTHYPTQPFFGLFHLDKNGKHPAPYTPITAKEYREGAYEVNPKVAASLGTDVATLQRQMIYYCEQLEATGKKVLMIWPYHCLIGHPGFDLEGLIYEAKLFHSLVMGVPNAPEIKGGNSLVESYSVLKPECTTWFNGNPIRGAQLNTKLVERLYTAKYVILAGQAKSHCLLSSFDDLKKLFFEQDQDSIKRLLVLADCASSVVTPGVVDYTDETEAAFEQFAKEGIRMIDSSFSVKDLLKGGN